MALVRAEAVTSMKSSIRKPWRRAYTPRPHGPGRGAPGPGGTRPQVHRALRARPCESTGVCGPVHPIGAWGGGDRSSKVQRTLLRRSADHDEGVRVNGRGVHRAGSGSRLRALYGLCVREERSTDIRLRESPIRNPGRAEVGVVRARQPRESGRSVPAGRRPTSASAFADLQSIAKGNRRM